MSISTTGGGGVFLSSFSVVFIFEEMVKRLMVYYTRVYIWEVLIMR
jgi:hypothetical protein